MTEGGPQLMSSVKGGWVQRVNIWVAVVPLSKTLNPSMLDSIRREKNILLYVTKAMAHANYIPQYVFDTDAMIRI